MNTNKTTLKIILGIVIFIALLIPIFIFLSIEQKEKEYIVLVDTIEVAAKKWAKGNMSEINGAIVNLEDLKAINFIQDNFINPKTKRAVSEQTYIEISKKNGEYVTNVVLYDIPKNEQTANLLISLVGDKDLQVGISSHYEELGINVSEGHETVEYSVQYFYKGKEVNEINTSRPKTYQAVYTALNNKGEIAKVVRNIIVQ